MRTRHRITRWAIRGWRVAWAVVLALVTPLLEKNPSKTATFSLCRVPMVLSMARVIVLLFAVAMLRQVERVGVAGWPEATLCIAIVLALPLLNALDRVSAEDTITVAKELFGRFGVGAARSLRSVYGTEPVKLDDHREDGGVLKKAG
jgi:hypothetical protein